MPIFPDANPPQLPTQFSLLPAYLSVPVLLVLPAGREFPVLAGEHVEEGDQVAVVLVALEGRRVAPDARHHVLHGRPVEQERLQRTGGIERE